MNYEEEVISLLSTSNSDGAFYQKFYSFDTHDVQQEYTIGLQKTLRIHNPEYWMIKVRERFIEQNSYEAYAYWNSPIPQFEDEVLQRVSKLITIIDKQRQELLLDATRVADTHRIQNSLLHQEKLSERTPISILYQELSNKGFFDKQAVSLESFSVLWQGEGGILQWEGKLCDLAVLFNALVQWNMISKYRAGQIQMTYKVRKGNKSFDEGTYKPINKTDLQSAISRVSRGENKISSDMERILMTIKDQFDLPDIQD